MPGCEWTKAGQLDPRAPGPSPPWSALGSTAWALQPNLSTPCAALYLHSWSPWRHPHAPSGLQGGRVTFGLLWEPPRPPHGQSASPVCWIHSKWVNERISSREHLCPSIVSLSKQDPCLVPESRSRYWVLCNKVPP